MAFIGQLGVTMLLSDSTNSGIEDFSISEKRVANMILEITRKASGRLIVATFASNMYRVAQILEAAVQCGRKVIVLGRSMENVVTIGRKLGNIKIPEKCFLTPEQLSTTPANKIASSAQAHNGRTFGGASRIANGTHRFIKLIPGDTIVFSSSADSGQCRRVNTVLNKRSVPVRTYSPNLS